MTKNKKTIFSGIQPSGDLHIGNYLGAISQWVPMQINYSCIFCVVDYHAITVKQDPKVLNKKITEIAKIYLASGINPKKSIIFQQSKITAHTETCWILNTIARLSDLNKMIQFKDKAGNNQENVSVGLYDYPILMAADILLYNTDTVPVGEDQSQHVEITRTLARRFNERFGEVFKIPELKIKKESARIMGLDDPIKKMSKSAKSEYNSIALLDSPEKATKKIMKAVTDSENTIKYNPEKKPAISNLMVIYSMLGDLGLEKIEKKYAGQGYGSFKKDLAEIVNNFLKTFQNNYNNITDAEVKKIMEKGADSIRPIADKTVKRVKEAMGIII